jgi:hypothetical protein
MRGHDEFLEAVEPRVTAALGLGLSAALPPAPADANSIADYLNRLAAMCEPVIKREGWRVHPRFPGRTSDIASVGRRMRVICAAELWSGNEQLGVVFTLVVSGRRPQISVAPAPCAVPAEWQPFP